MLTVGLALTALGWIARDGASMRGAGSAFAKTTGRRPSALPIA